MKAHRSNRGSGSRRGDELAADQSLDPYRNKAKPAAACVCPDCGAAYQRGRWSWSAPLEGAVPQVCPACLRIRERQPAGVVRLGGGFLAAHKQELLSLLRNVEKKEKDRHPLRRIMQITENDTGVEATTTDVHLARRLGEALRRSYHGTLGIAHPTGEYLVRVRWQR